MYFNNFFQPLLPNRTRRYPKSFIKEAYQRAAAPFLPGNFPGADIDIPFRLTDGEYSLILIQVKNWVNGNRSNVAKQRAK